ncbi:toxin A [Lachnospiraceae bacterium]|nr:toxin A [Lachnospiraceae bacterium]
MKKHRQKPLLIGVLILLSAIFLCGRPVAAADPEVMKEIMDISPEDTEFDHYTDEDGIQTYASPFTGNIEHLVIFVRFAGENEYITPAGIQNAEAVYNQGYHSLKEYLSRMSYGAVNISTSYFPKNASGAYCSVQLSKKADYFKMNRDGTIPEGYTNEGERKKREDELIVEAVEAAKQQIEAADLELDRNRDGCIDGISFIVSTRNPSSENISHGDLLWAHKTSLSSGVNLSVNGSRVNTYNLVNRGTETGILGSYGSLSHTVRHEFLHTMSLPDLYRYSDTTVATLGPWDIMDKGNAANMTAYYQREYLGFGDRLPVYTSSQKKITLKTAQYKDPSEKYAVILKPASHPNEYFVVEKREIEKDCGGSEYEGMEYIGQKNAGLLVYRIAADPKLNTSAASGNSQGPPDFIYAFRPGESRANAGDGKISHATVSPNNPEGFTSLGKPLGEETPGYDNKTIYYTDGSNSGIVINNLVVNSDNSITFDVTFPEPIKGSGTKDNPYEIYTAQNLYSMSTSSSGTYYKLMNDIDMSNVKFTPIQEFKGILDGNNKTIKNLSTSQNSEAAFINTVQSGATVKNLIFSNPTLTASDGYTAVFSENFGTLDNIRVNGGSITSKAGKYSSRAGGLAGVLNYPGAIKNCYTSAAVNANEAGGLVSYLSGGSITNSYSCGKVTGLGNNPVTGGTFAYWMNQGGGTAQNTYWDILGTGQTANGRIWGTSTPANVSGCYGLKLECPSSVKQNGTAAAKVSSPNGSVPSGGTWKSSNTSVMTVNSSTGLITGVKGGTAAISYNFKLGTVPAALGRTVTCQSDGSSGGSTGGNTGGSTSTNVITGKWVSSNGRWWFSKTGGSYPRNGIYSINGTNYAFDSSGWMITGWYASNGKWYYFNGSGAMAKGWVKVSNKWYYMNSSGVMLTGWQKIGSAWYYMNSSGVMLTGWQRIGGKWYYMNGSGVMLTGWQKIGGKWYYFSGSGAMFTGWQKIGGKWYYFSGSGAMLTGWQKIGGKWYYMNGSGAMLTGWQKIGGKWYYMNSSGAMLTGRQYIGGTYYNLGSDGSLR